ncbi:MAG: hypothetical protein PF447_03385 [Spirochaetaceae bacterium]|jgi:hypothetical protein|nr:hypothetical protein [Spirochaetaceae bacterium]
MVDRSLQIQDDDGIYEYSLINETVVFESYADGFELIATTSETIGLPETINGPISLQVVTP